MSSSTKISLDEYFRTSYEPEAEYVQGETEERIVGEYDHSTTKAFVAFWFREHDKQWGTRSAINQSTLLNPALVRITDVSVFRRDQPIEQVFTYPQLIAIEVLSPEDRQSRLRQRIQDFIDFGVENMWVIHPVKRVGWDCSDGNWTRKERFEVAGCGIYLSLDELFARSDADEAD